MIGVFFVGMKRVCDNSKQSDVSFLFVWMAFVFPYFLDFLLVSSVGLLPSELSVPFLFYPFVSVHSSNGQASERACLRAHTCLTVNPTGNECMIVMINSLLA